MQKSRSSSKSQKEIETIKVKKEIPDPSETASKAMSIQVETEIASSPDPTGQTPMDMVAVPTSESGANGVVVATSEGQENAGVADSLANKEVEVDMTNSFLALQDADTEKTVAKDTFKNCSIAVPLIALKKFKLCLDQEGIDPNLTLALLGSVAVQQYKTSKPCLNGMVVADAIAHGQFFWERIGGHLQTKPITAIFLSEGFEASLQDVACCNFANKRGSLKSVLLVAIPSGFGKGKLVAKMFVIVVHINIYVYKYIKKKSSFGRMFFLY